MVSLISKLSSADDGLDEPWLGDGVVGGCCGGGGGGGWMDGTGTFTPQCFASFMCVVRAANEGKLCLHQTHLSTSLAESAPLLSQCDCHALWRLVEPGAADPIGLYNSSFPSLLSSLIFSSAFVASVGEWPVAKEGLFSGCFNLPFHSDGSAAAAAAIAAAAAAVEPAPLFGERLEAAATAAAKYGKWDATTGEVHGDTTDLKSGVALTRGVFRIGGWGDGDKLAPLSKSS